MGHVRDHWGGRIDGWREAAHLSNYWRRYFDIDEVPYTLHQSGNRPQSAIPEDPSPNDDTDWTERHASEDQEDDNMSTAANPRVHDAPVPIQIHQLATIFYNVLIQDLEYNAPILERLQVGQGEQPQADPRPFNAAVLAHLGQLAITTNQLARAARKIEYGEEFGTGSGDFEEYDGLYRISAHR